MKLISNFWFATILIGVVSLASSGSAVAQRNPTMPSQINDSEREALYSRFSENKKVPISERQRQAYEAAKEYINRFNESTDKYLPEMRRFVSEYERVLRQYDLYTNYTSKNYVKVFEMGRSILTADPDNFYVLSVLSEAGYDESRSGKTALDDESAGYTKRAIEVLEGGKVTKTDPFSNAETARGFLNFALGWFIRTKDPVEAAAAFRTAASTESSYKTNAITYNLLGNTLLKGEYTKLSTEYNEKFGNKPPSPEQEAMLSRIVKVGDRIVDAYARAVALTTQPEQQEGKAKMLAQLTNLYKGFHNNSDAGLSELIASVLSKPLP
jgi:hypothetical protein